MRKKIMIPDLYAKYEKGEPITMLTAYDYPMAMLEEKAGVEIILVGDSMGMTVYGLDTTLPVTLDMIIRHAQAVRRGAPTAFIVGDMPYMTYQVNKDEAIRNAGRLMAEAGVDCIKLEGGQEMAETIAAIVKATIPVMGHIGLTPQSISQLGGFKAQGRSAESALKLVEDAKALEAAGCFSILVEAVPPEVNKVIVETVKVPIISLGSGVYGAGQCLIVHDMLGFFDRFTPKFVKKYANLNAEIVKALEAYVTDVKEKGFPGPEHVYPMSQEEVENFLAQLKR
ncbi:3-methyl-2-oxobutanoate hydroxymethyltransferase [Desulfallas sp. Bu1-1]|uniref:3-methyl-2-oxobutanoate hydroxymethyltransferase n=1 Tax=Desulfallas sp. Bu1-1 TaxID=2787620 RepID=UPI0018A11A39|nr:3-methyl-2-oxobutanoate hydroxymethyltransferase [Desulfallas sp. Bu1-1]MBF7084061.1 3-methyl-2-oxobutanoate hydroxymethyltransferase [Desulfallas sp. Bu1-1]